MPIAYPEDIAAAGKKLDELLEPVVSSTFVPLASAEAG
jgi:hypothetical protein